MERQNELGSTMWQQPHQTRQAFPDRVLPRRKKSWCSVQSQPPRVKPQSTQAPQFERSSRYCWESKSESKLFSGVPRGETGAFTIPLIPLPYHGTGEQIAGDLLPEKIKAGKKLISSKEVQKQRRMTKAPRTLLQKGLENWHHPVPLLVPHGAGEPLKWNAHSRVGPCCFIWTGETDPKPHLWTGDAEAQGGLKGWDSQHPAPAIAEKIMVQCHHHRTVVNKGVNSPSKWNHQWRALTSLDFCEHIFRFYFVLYM